MFTEINTLDEFQKIMAENDAVLVYFYTNECHVCRVLKPKVEELLEVNFPLIARICVNTNKAPDVAAQNRIFGVPTILVFFSRGESLRKSRIFGVEELKNEIQRLYQLMFS